MHNIIDRRVQNKGDEIDYDMCEAFEMENI